MKDFDKWLIHSLFIGFSMLSISCREDSPAVSDQTLFRYVHPSSSGVDFSNEITYDEQVNPYTFRNFFNGAGVAIGDLNNDGLTDLVLAGNMVATRVYLNQGNLKFKDITSDSGLGTDISWVTGVSLADVDQDGRLDIYLCKSGPPGGKRRKNELFINQGDNTFRESAEAFGLDFEGLAVQAVFLDFDLDEDPDCYLLNNSYRPVGVFDYLKDQRRIPDPSGGNRLLRNDGGEFTDITSRAGIYSSAIGFGLGVTVGDVNNDGWPDMFVSNDFFEKDYLYINNRNGSFREAIEEYMDEISLGSMGADMADLNNDGLPEIFVTEMLPEHDARLKTNGQFENWNRYQQAVAGGYFRQFGRNVLQLNNGDGSFSEIGRFSGVAATDWSWGALLFDMDNDGLKDIFVANGIYKDLLDQDYVTYVANPDFIRKQIRERGKVLKQLIDSIPSNRLPNYAFHNQGGMRFTDRSLEWGLDFPTHSNGSAYGDLDNDGDLDLVINNINQPAGIYENRSRQLLPQHHSVSLQLLNRSNGTAALGARATAWTSGIPHVQEVSPMRGFMSSSDTRLVIGVGTAHEIDSLVVEWPGGKRSRLVGVPTDTILALVKTEAADAPLVKQKKSTPLLTENTPDNGLDFVHRENDFVDFDRDRLLFHMISNEGPCLCTGDANGDGLDDVYIGGAKGQPGGLYLQRPKGRFESTMAGPWKEDAGSEDTDCVMTDLNGDGRLDLYVASGGVEFSSSSMALSDRIYFNTGSGRFRKSPQILPTPGRLESTAAVDAVDFDRDGDTDLFVGIRSIPFQYGLPCNGYLLINDGAGNMKDRTAEAAPGLRNIGMITDAKWTDINRDGSADLVLVGEWLGIRIFIQEKGRLEDRSETWGTGHTRGWYHTVETSDLNHDGFPDIVAGNHGMNSRFRASLAEPVEMFINDFDSNGTLDHLLTRYDESRSYPLVLRNDLISQIPSLKRRLLYFKQYSGKQLSEIFPKELMDSSLRLVAETMETGLWMNQNGTRLSKGGLPQEAQYFPVYAIASADIDKDGHSDLLLGGNQFRAKPETGIYAEGHGLLLVGDGKGSFATVKSSQSGLQVKGEIRSIRVLGRQVLMGLNNNRIKSFQLSD